MTVRNKQQANDLALITSVNTGLRTYAVYYPLTGLAQVLTTLDTVGNMELHGETTAFERGVELSPLRDLVKNL